MRYPFVLILFVFTGCSNVQDKLENTIQSENAKDIKTNYKELVELLLEYKIKLDKRNPQAYSSQLNQILTNSIKNNSDDITLYVDNSVALKDYQDYLNYAFEKEKDVLYRNDYLAIGIYKMFYESFDMDSEYKMTAFGYDTEKLQKAYKNLQIIQWKIKFNKDSQNNYLFLTWQNNWQIELEKRLATQNIQSINLDDLKYIKSTQESLLDPSNSSFEVVTSKMLLYYERTLKTLHTEPEELAVETFLTFLFFI
jgi:hypothetical protein